MGASAKENRKTGKQEEAAEAKGKLIFSLRNHWQNQ